MNEKERSMSPAMHQTTVWSLRQTVESILPQQCYSQQELHVVLLLFINSVLDEV